jgi:hypothetical protein
MSMCAMTPELRDHLSAQVDEWAGEGTRLLGLAYRAGGIFENYGVSWETHADTMPLNLSRVQVRPAVEYAEP